MEEDNKSQTARLSVTTSPDALCEARRYHPLVTCAMERTVITACLWLDGCYLPHTEQRLNISFKKSHVALNFNRVVQSHRLSFFVAQPNYNHIIILGTLWEATHLPSSRFSLMWQVSVNVGLREGWVGSFPGSKLISPENNIARPTFFNFELCVVKKYNQNKRSCSVFVFIWESLLISFRVYNIRKDGWRYLDKILAQLRPKKFGTRHDTATLLVYGT